MSVVVVRNLETGGTRVIDVLPGAVVSLWPPEYVASPLDDEGKEIVRLERERNRIAAEGLELHREHIAIMREEQAQRNDVAAALLGHGDDRAAWSNVDTFTAESVPAGPGVGQREPAGSTSPGQGVGTDSADPLPRLYAILRDPRTSPAGWVSQVKRTYADRGDAFIEAKRLAAKHGGRFLVLEVTSYAEAMPRIGLGYPGDEPAELNDLPF